MNNHVMDHLSFVKYTAMVPYCYNVDQYLTDSIFVVLSLTTLPLPHKHASNRLLDMGASAVGKSGDLHDNVNQPFYGCTMM